MPGYLDALIDAIGYVGSSLDKPGAAVRGLLAGDPNQLLNLVPFSDAMGVTDPSQRVSGRDLLEKYGVLGQNTPGLDVGDVAGFFAEEALDPVNWIPGGFLAKRGLKAVDELGSAAKAVDKLPASMGGDLAATLDDLGGLMGRTQVDELAASGRSASRAGPWSNDLESLADDLGRQEVAEIDDDWLFDKRRMEAVPPAHQADPNAAFKGTVFDPVDVETTYRGVHGKRLGRYRQWLKENAELDEYGEPLRLYHGTGDAFDEFDPNRFGKGAGGNLVGQGVYLTDDADVASEYANRTSWLDDDGNISSPANVRMQHVLKPVLKADTRPGQAVLARAGRREFPDFPAYADTAEQFAKYRLVKSIQEDMEKIFSGTADEQMNLLEAFANAEDYGDEAFRESLLSGGAEQRLEEVSRAMDVGFKTMQEVASTLKNMPQPANNEFDIIRDIKRALSGKRGGFETQHDVSLKNILPQFSGVRHSGGNFLGRRQHSAYAMFDPKDVLPANPDPAQIQSLAERFMLPDGSLPFSLLLGGAGLGGAAYVGSGYPESY